MIYYFKTEKLCVGYNSKPLIKDITIGIEKGHILTLIGPNGAGKSTVLKSIAGQLEKIEGSVYLSDRDIKDYSKKDLSKNMAVMFTDKLKTDMMSCEEVVSSGRYPYTGHFGLLTQNDRDAVNEVIKEVGIEEFKDADFNRISDGQRQRVLLAKALCQEPEILLLDEPTSYLDIRHKLEFLSVIEKLKNEKKMTIIMSMHELDLARRISDEVLCLKGDHVDRFGTAKEVFEDEYIRNLFGIEEDLFRFATEKGIQI